MPLLLLLVLLLLPPPAAGRVIIRPPETFSRSGAVTAGQWPQHVTPADAAYVIELEALMDHGAPLRVARAAWAALGVYPVSFARSLRWWVPPPPASPYDVLTPEALAAAASMKDKEWSTLMPVNYFSWRINNESEYIKQYVTAWKAHTWAKRGVDCNRHLEIIASGTLPMFRDLGEHPSTVAFAYPRPLFAHIYRHRDEGSLRRLALMRHYLLVWGYAHLTAPAMVRYMAEVAGQGMLEELAGGMGRVLFLDTALPGGVDYLSNSLLEGLVEWLGHDRVDVLARPAYMYEGEATEVGPSGEQLYGLAFGHRGVLAPYVYPAVDTMLERLARGKYAAVVWGSWFRSKVLWQQASQVYKGQRHRLWVCDGEDIHEGWAFQPGSPREEATVFIRELLV